MIKKRNRFDFSRISFNAGLLVREMQKRGIFVKYIPNTEIIIAKSGKHSELLFDIQTR